MLVRRRDIRVGTINPVPAVRALRTAGYAVRDSFRGAG